MTSILLTVTGAKASASVTGPLTSGMVGIPVTIEYDEAWAGLTKNLMCRCSPWGSNDGEIRTILNVGETAAVAHEVMQPDMYLYLGVEGFSDDGKIVIPTTWARCEKIEYGANTCEDPSTNQELSVWNQLQTEIAQIRQNTAQKETSTTVSVGDNPVTLDGTAPEQTVNLAWMFEGERTVPAFTNYYIAKSNISYPRAFDTAQYVQFWSNSAGHGNADAFVSGHKYFHAMKYRMDGDSTAKIHTTGEVLSGSGWWYEFLSPVTVSTVNFALGNTNTGTGTIDYVYCIDITALEEAGIVAEGMTVAELVELFGELPLVPGENYAGGTVSDGTATLSISRGGEVNTVGNASGTVTVRGGDILSVEGGSVTFMLKVYKTVTSSGAWEGIKWVALGDSLTDGSINADTKYHKLIAESTGITVADMGKGGTGYWRTHENGTAFYQRMANIPADAGIVTIFGSVNDWRTKTDGVEIGTASDTLEAGTLAGYINEAINVAVATAPYAQIALITPMDYHGIPDNIMEDISNIIAAVATYRKVKCLDLYHESGFRVDDPVFAQVYCTDYSETAETYGHPSNLAHEKIIAPEFMELLRRMILID